MVAAIRAPTRRLPFGQIDGLRVLLHAAMLVTALVAPGGRYLFVVAGAITLSSLTLNVLRSNRPLSLIVPWELGFFLLVVMEGAFTAEDIIGKVSGAAYAVASRYLIAANSLVVIGHAIVYRAARFQGDRREVWRYRSDHAVLFLVTVSCLYYMIEIPWAAAVLANGRNVAFSFGPGPVAPLVQGFVLAAGFALPSIYVFTFTRVLHRSVRGAVLLSLPVLCLHFVVGTRFPLLFAVAGMYFSNPGNEQLRPRLWARGLVLLGVIVFAMSVMVQFRAQGLSNLDLTAVASELVAQGFDTSEEIVLTETRIVDHYGRRPHLDGESTSSLFVFWVPRVLWPGKPTLLEYWFPREYGLSGFPDNHSIAAGFPADGYADFGFAGGLLTMLLVGLGLGAVDRGCSRVLVDRGSPYVVLVGPLFGATFFAVRSMNTAIIAAVGVLALSWAFARAIRPHVWSPEEFLSVSAEGSGSEIGGAARMSDGPV